MIEGSARPDVERPDVDWLEPLLGLGSRPYAQQRPAIARALGVQAVVALHEPSPGEAADWYSLGVEYRALPTTDWIAVPLRRFDVTTDALLELLGDGRKVLLHCLAGVNRAPTVAAALLCRRDGLAPDEAVARVRAARPAAAPTPEQIASLRAWASRLPRAR